MTDGHLSRANTELFKGVGILLIVLHNYFHWVGPSPGENEFNFSRDRTVRLFDMLFQHPLEAVNLMFDYFGHYGVQIFIFLSAYGLARSYMRQEARWLPFMLRRVGRLYPVFVLAVLAHLLFVVTPWHEHLGYFIKVYLLKLSMLSAFVPDMPFALVGPWWFFSFIVQFYAVFPMLNRLTSRHGNRALVATGLGAMGVTVAFNPYVMDHGLNLYVTVVGHLPVLCLGIYLARQKALRIGGGAALAAGLLFGLGLWTRAAWLFAPLCVTVVFLYLLPCLFRVLKATGLTARFVAHCGAISLPLFAIHGMLREPFTEAANAQGQWWFTLVVAAVFLVTSLAAARFMFRAERVVMSWLSGSRRAGSR